ncbi:MAG: xanthine dehydrogenase [Acidobacteria bacterium]|nr:MAG: xanthine dehydrogenase [Acidobacteriota bacterium]
MKEITEILARVTAFGPKEQGILATVVDVQGSGYRLPGARMLILENGETHGMVSGGCLESDVLERARKVLKSGQSEVFVYDTTNEENSVFSLNMGCRGVIRILLEPINGESTLLKYFRDVRDDRTDRTMATLISSDESSDAKLGGRAFYKTDGSFEFDRLPVFLQSSEVLRDECARFSDRGTEYTFHEFTIEERRFEFALESIRPPVHVLLFGAGADAIPLARTVSDLGWQLSVFDHRPAFLTKERFADATRLTPTSREEKLDPILGDARTVAVVMTHNYELDRKILPSLLNSDIAYVGMLGPKRRTEQMLGEISSAGQNFSDDQLAKLYAPAGLDIGADTPEAIALSIAAEIQTVLRTRDGGHLRNRKGSIYDRK